MHYDFSTRLTFTQEFGFIISSNPRPLVREGMKYSILE